MTELVHLPPEILSCITQALDGFDIATLWCTGDACLRVRLENGGVTRFKLKLRQETTRKWPNLISRFNRLEYLSIGPKPDHSIWFRSDIDLLGVSRSLKHLKLHFENSEMILLGIPFVIEDLHPDPTFSPPTKSEMTLAPLPIADHFIELQTLILKGKPTVPHILVSHLPQTLLRLSISHESLNADFFTHLPPQLTSLELPKLAKLENETVIFPPGLTRLYLPSFKVKMPHSLSSIPRSVIELTIFNIDLDFSASTRFLPPNLVLLSIYWAHNLGDDLLGCLPKSLRHLKTKYPSETTKIDSLPPGLQSLTAPDIAIVPAESLFLLPRTLTKLRMRDTNVSPESLKNFPDNLQVLALNVDISASMSSYGFMRTLEKLDVLSIGAEALVFMPRLSKIECAFFRGDDLSGLKTLSRLRFIHLLYDMTIDLEFIQCLPESLESLELSTKNRVSSFVAHSLPQSLQFLRINGENTVPSSFIEHLPPRLTELVLDSLSTISDASIRLLPRTLEALVLTQVSQITDEGIRNLPPHLTDCKLEKVHLLTDQCVPFFPRRITRLYLDRCVNISNAAVQYLPRTLTSLDFAQNAKLTTECIPHLPPRLKYFHVKNRTLSVTWRVKVSSTTSFISLLKKEAKQIEELE